MTSKVWEAQRCEDCQSILLCEDCAKPLNDCECVFSGSLVNAPDMYCSTCEPQIHVAALDRVEQNRRYEELLRQTDIDEGYNPYDD